MFIVGVPVPFGDRCFKSYLISCLWGCGFFGGVWELILCLGLLGLFVFEEG